MIKINLLEFNRWDKQQWWLGLLSIEIEYTEKFLFYYEYRPDGKFLELFYIRLLTNGRWFW